MKKLLILFGILDIVTIVRNYDHLTNFRVLWGELHWITIATSSMFASLIFSSYFLVKQNKVGIWLTYGQFPFRLTFMAFSFGFFLTLVNLLDYGPGIYKAFIWGLTGLEILRLIITIQIHRGIIQGQKHRCSKYNNVAI